MIQLSKQSLHGTSAFDAKHGKDGRWVGGWTTQNAQGRIVQRHVKCSACGTAYTHEKDLQRHHQVSNHSGVTRRTEY